MSKGQNEKVRDLDVRSERSGMVEVEKKKRRCRGDGDG
jgi:hypothetical protein